MVSPFRSPRSKRRSGFSLIELLINLAIISALVGLAVPFFSSYTSEAQRTKARADLDVMRDAIQRFEQGGRVLGGSSLKPLLGATLQELPVDPWGLEYVLDGNLGLLGTLGADGTLYGDGGDADIILEYNAFLVPVAVRYEGPYGPPQIGNKLVLKTSKVFGIVPTLEGEVANDIVVVREEGAVPLVPLGALGFTLDWAETRPNEGRLVLTCTNPALNALRIPISAKDLVDFSPLVLSFSERPSPGAPFLADAGNWVVGPRPVGGGRLGIPVQRRSL